MLTSSSPWLRPLLCATVLLPCAAPALVVTAPTVTNGSTPHSAPYGLANAVNGGAEEYASQGLGAGTFLEFTFPSSQRITGVAVINRDSPNGSDWIGNFTLTFDGSASVSITRTPERGTSAIHSLGGAFTGSVVRLGVDTIGVGSPTNTNNTGVLEVVFLNTSAALTPITGVSVLGSAAAHSAPYVAANALNGLVGRVGGLDYASAGLGNGAYVDFDLGGVRSVRGFDFFDRVHAADRVTGFDMIFSQDDIFGNGDDILRSYTNAGIALGDEFAGINARYVRYDVTASSGANTGLGEVIFYQAIPEPSVAASLALALGAWAARRRRA